MSKEEREFLDDLRTKSIEAAAEIMESLQRLKSLYDEITDDSTGSSLPRPRTGDFFYRLAKFELEHASNVIRLGNSQAELIFDHVRQLARRSKPGAVSIPVVQLELAPGGKRYVGTFEIKNTFDKEADARFELEPLRDASGAKTTIKPIASCGKGRIAAYRTAEVEISVPREAITDTMFGEVAVFLVGEVERQIAKRAIKVRPSDPPPKKRKK